LRRKRRERRKATEGNGERRRATGAMDNYGKRRGRRMRRGRRSRESRVASRRRRNDCLGLLGSPGFSCGLLSSPVLWHTLVLHWLPLYRFMCPWCPGCASLAPTAATMRLCLSVGLSVSFLSLSPSCLFVFLSLLCLCLCLSRLISAGKDKPRGGAKKSYRPERSKLRCVRGREKADSKPSRPISAGKDKPRGGAKRAIGPKGQN
jgi:hypothetical protein